MTQGSMKQMKNIYRYQFTSGLSFFAEETLGDKIVVEIQRREKETPCHGHLDLKTPISFVTSFEDFFAE